MSSEKRHARRASERDFGSGLTCNRLAGAQDRSGTARDSYARDYAPQASRRGQVLGGGARGLRSAMLKSKSNSNGHLPERQMSKLVIWCVAVIALLLANGRSNAQSIGYADAIDRFAGACSKDINKFCKKINLGGGGI